MKHKELQDLLNEIDYYRYSHFDSDKVEELQAQLEEYGRAKKRQASYDPAFVAYPEYSDPDFYGKIYRKKEFNKRAPSTKQTFEEVVKSKCSSAFRLTNNQSFLKNFLSPSTPYNGILLYHGVGVGKCFRYNTPILMYDGSTKPVQDITVGDRLMGDDSRPRCVLNLSPPAQGKLFTIKQKYGVPYTVNSEHVLTLINPQGQIVDIPLKNFMALPPSEQKTYQGCKSNIILFEREEWAGPDYQLAYKIGNIHSESNLLPLVKYGSVCSRAAFLAGYIDSCATITSGSLSVPWNNDFVYVAQSLSIGVINIPDSSHIILEGAMLKRIPTILINMNNVNTKSQPNDIEIISHSEPENYYGFEVDGNHRFLLGDFTVTHNSCSAISIAEQFIDVFDKRTILLMPSNLKENFKRQIFDIGKESQCTGNRYRALLGDDTTLLSTEILEKRANRIVNDHYQFLGFQEFANSVIRMRETLRNETQFISFIKTEFSNRVIIIDEVHNVREGEDGFDKIVTPILLQVIQTAENIKLVLLSATPMFNEASEIVWLINLLLANDKRPLLQPSDFFSSSGKLTTEGREKLRTYARGYISYMQGENPFTFPLRLYPSINGDTRIQKSPPKLDIKGVKIAKAQRLSKLELIESHLSPTQLKMLNYNADITDEQTNTQLIQVSNVIFPNETYGTNGIKGAFNKTGNQYSYKSANLQFFSQDHIAGYAPKIKTIVDYIKKCQGICFVYSYFIDSGIIPMAMALEHIGFARYNGPRLLSGIQPQPKPFLINGKQACYSIISARKELTTDFDGDIAMARSDKNVDGEIIKVILGTSVAAEGLDLKCIREMHMMDPWYHLNKMEQIIGRGIRNCSHINLPPSMRNVTLYHHICVNKDSPNESIDERIYRIAENKQVHIDEVESLLKSVAIDCHINQLDDNASSLPDKMKIVTSQGTAVTHKLVPSSKKQVCSETIAPTPIDKTTFNKQFYLTDAHDLAPTVAALFIKTHFATFEDIQKSIKLKNADVDEDILIYTLDYMLDTKFPVHHGVKEVPGYLIYRSNVYLFQPRSLNDLTIPFGKRQDYESPKVDILAVTATTSKVKESDKPVPENIVTRVEKEVAATATAYKKFATKAVFYDFVIDRLDWASIFELATTASLSPDLEHALQRAHIFIKDLPWVRNIYSEQVEYYNRNTKQKVSSRELQNAAANLVVPAKTLEQVKGYVDPSKKPAKFKILDPAKTKSAGFVCAATSTLKIGDLRNMIKPLTVGDDTKKPVFCDLYELKLRSEGTFARPYEARLLFSLKMKAAL